MRAARAGLAALAALAVWAAAGCGGDDGNSGADPAGICTVSQNRRATPFGSATLFLGTTYRGVMVYTPPSLVTRVNRYET